MCVLLDVCITRIGVILFLTARTGRLCVYYGNKCGSPLRAFTVDISESENTLGVRYKPPVGVLEAGAQVQQLFDIECKGVFTSSPKLRIRFKYVCITVRAFAKHLYTNSP